VHGEERVLKFSFDSQSQMASPTLIEIKKKMESVYNELDIKFVTEDIPISRSLQLADDGVIDGELFPRSSRIEEKTKNLLRIPVLVFKGHIYLLGIHSDPNKALKKDLKKARFVHIRGHLSAVTYLKTEHLKNITEVNSFAQAVKMLKTKRADYTFVLEPKESILNSPNKELFKSDAIHVSHSPVFSMDMYFFLHKKNQDLIEKITKKLKPKFKENI